LVRSRTSDSEAAVSSPSGTLSNDIEQVIDIRRRANSAFHHIGVGK